MFVRCLLFITCCFPTFRNIEHAFDTLNDRTDVRQSNRRMKSRIGEGSFRYVQGYLVVLCGTANICSICVTRTTRDIVLSFSNAFLFYGPFRGVTLISMHRNINVCDGGSIVRLVHSNICSIIISLHFFHFYSRVLLVMFLQFRFAHSLPTYMM